MDMLDPNFQKPAIEVIRPNWNAPSNVKAFFTLRYGGVSSGKYGSENGLNGLNLGMHVGDNINCVKANRSMLDSLGCTNIKWLNQVHSHTVVEAGSIGQTAPDADASFTTSNNVGCVVMTADCLPVLLCDTEGKIVGVSHAGWKGLADGVIQATVKAMRSRIGENSSFMAWLGPRIGEKAFTVRNDVREYYLASSLWEAVDEAIIPNADSYLLNLACFAKLALKQVGITEVFDCGLSTFENERLFYSYRRDKVTGRHAAVIYKG